MKIFGSEIQESIKLTSLINCFLDQPWHKECEIIPDFMPKNPGPDTKPTVKIKCGEWFLRHSKGPKQEYFWDVYGDDMYSVEVAIYALTKTQPPPPGKPYIEFSISLKKK